MKQGIRTKTIILLCGLLLGVSGIQAQPTGDIDSLSQWRVYVLSFDGYDFVTYQFKYYISGTVTTDSNEYFEVYRSGYSYVTSANPSYFNDVYAGAIREHENKWYALNYLNEDVLLYDFNMNVGDTVESTTTMGATITVISIDTTMVDGEPKRRFFLDYAGFGNGETYILEDVGASSGLFEPIFWIQFESELYCYAIDYVPLWLNPESGICNLSVKIDEPQESQNISTYPNPFTASTTIEYELTGISNLQFTVYNLQGVVVYETEECAVQPGTHKVKWSPSPIPSGMYYGVLRTEEGVSAVKIIKQ